jgi:hypothetical protein
MKQKILLVIIGAAFLAGCTKSPTNVLPTNAYSTANYPNSLDGLNSVLAGCYSDLRDANLYGFNLLPKALASATHTCNAPTEDAYWNEMGTNNVSIQNTYVDGAWQALFVGVKNCNVLLDAAGFYQKTYAHPTDQPSIDLIRGQAYFMRAFYYFNLENYFGEDHILNPSATDTLGVPIFTAVPTSLGEAQKPRSSIKAVWALIESDLTQAAALLKGQVWTGQDVDRVTEWSAKALLGKAYVFTQDYTDAKTVLLDVINNSGKSLMDYTTYANSFVGITSAKANSEALFEMNIDGTANGNGYGIYGTVPNSTSIMGLIWPPFCLGGDGTEANAQPLGYGNEVMHDKSVRRFGWTMPNYTLVSNPDYNAAKGPGETNPQQTIDPAYKAAALAARTNLTVDPRLFVNALEPQVDSVEPDGKTFVKVSHPNYYLNGPNDLAFSCRKYAPIFNNINNLGPADVSDIYFIRLAEVYLLYAEASMNSGDNPTALEYLNRVKRRAYGLPSGTPSAIDYKSLTDQTPAASANDPVLGHNPLYYERWAELFNEGEWWFDICRWHLGESEAAFYVTALNNTSASNTLTFNTANYAWPIPLNEINTNPQITKQQNPGY